MNGFFTKKDFSATRMKNSSNIYLPIVYFKLQNRNEQEAFWAAAIQVTIPLETIDTLT